MTDREMMKEARRDKRDFQDNLKDILRNLNPSKLHKQFTAQKKHLTEERADYRATHEGQKLPDPKMAIQAYFDSEPTRALYRQLEVDFYKKRVLKELQMSGLSRKYLKRLFARMGIRLQVFGSTLTRKKFFDAVDIAASFPYVRPDQNSGLNPRYINNQLAEDMPLYVRENPYQNDPGDPNDPRQREDWEVQQGIAIPIEYHKTGHKYTIWLWFSQVETYYLRMYESIAANYCLAKKINLLPDGSIDPESPLFINGKGGPTVYTNMFPLDFSDFAMAAGIPSATSYIFRKMFSKLLLAQESLNLREAEEWTMGHAPATAKDSYQDALTKKFKACR